MTTTPTRAAQIAELRAKLLDEHKKAAAAADTDERAVYTLIANETAREIVMLLAAIHSPHTNKKGR